MENKPLKIGLFGFGVVGEGLYRVLAQTPSLEASIVKVCIRQADKKRNAPAELFTTDAQVLLNDPEINTIVEVIDDSTAAYQIVTTALRQGKAVVSASKKMIADNLAELLALQAETGLPFLYEAAACASIPVIRNLEEYYDNDLLHAIKAVVNGSTNFILTKMFDEQIGFTEALLQAQQLGFAESNPSLDVEGHDAVNKWSILLNHAYGIVAHPRRLLFTGIQNIQGSDAAVAREKGFDIKLVAQAKKLKNGKVAAFVLPQWIGPQEPLRFVRNEYNGVVIESGFADQQFFYGKGAGSFPTASAVLSDLSALRYQYKYEYKKLYRHQPHALTHDYYLRVYLSFSDWKYILRESFEWIEEWHAQAERKYLVGVIHVSHLLHEDWWQENGTTLVLTPDPIIDDLDLVQVKKKSLELAGIAD